MNPRALAGLGAQIMITKATVGSFWKAVNRFSDQQQSAVRVAIIWGWVALVCKRW